MFVGLRICGSEANNVASNPGYRSSCETALAASREDWARLVERGQGQATETQGKSWEELHANRHHRQSPVPGQRQTGLAKRKSGSTAGLVFSSFAPRNQALGQAHILPALYETTTTTILEVLSGLDRWGGPVTRCFRGEKSQQPRYQIGLSQYSLRAMFKDGSLDPLDYPAFSVDQFGINQLDLWEGGLPKDKLDDTKYLKQLKRRAKKANAELFLLMTGALDANPQKRDASLKQILPSLSRAQILGCEFVRVFLRAPAAMRRLGGSECRGAQTVVRCCCEKNVVIAIEPGASQLSQRGAFLAKVAKKLNHPACKLMPDFGKLRNNVYDGTEAMMPYTATISCKMHSFDDKGNQPDFDYSRLMKIIDKAGYRGILAIEWEGHKLKPVPGVKASKN